MKKRTKVTLSVVGALLLLGGCAHNQVSRQKNSQSDTLKVSTMEQSEKKKEEPKSEKPAQSQEPASSQRQPEPDPAAKKEQPEEALPTAADGIRPEFKAAMDEYESFYAEYVSFLQRYQQNPSDLGLLMEMADWTQRVSDIDAKLEEWDAASDSMNSAELQFYLETTGRIYQMLSQAAL